MTVSSHVAVDCNRFILAKSVLLDKSLTPARLFVSAFGGSRWNLHTPHWEATGVGLKVSSSLCHDRAPVLAESSSRALIGDHVCTCDPS